MRLDLCSPYLSAGNHNQCAITVLVKYNAMAMLDCAGRHLIPMASLSSSGFETGGRSGPGTTVDSEGIPSACPSILNCQNGLCEWVDGESAHSDFLCLNGSASGGRLAVSFNVMGLIAVA